MPESFKAAGYQTAMMGKWHLGHCQQSFHPNDRGFDHFYGHLHTEVGFYPPFANNGVRGRLSAPPGWRAPLDWADYPRPNDSLQQLPATSMAPDERTLYRLDYQMGERGRLVYNCEPVNLEEGVCRIR